MHGRMDRQTNTRVARIRASEAVDEDEVDPAGWFTQNQELDVKDPRAFEKRRTAIRMKLKYSEIVRYVRSIRGENRKLRRRGSDVSRSTGLDAVVLHPSVQCDAAELSAHHRQRAQRCEEEKTPFTTSGGRSAFRNLDSFVRSIDERLSISRMT